MNMSKMTMAAAGILAAALGLKAESVKLGWNERGGVFVDKGETVMQDGNIILEQNAKFYKSGAGQLNLPLSKMNAQKPYSLTVLGGTVDLEAGTDATVDVATPPAALQKATFWINTDSTVVTGANLVAKWCDVRETDTASPKRWYAVPRWDARATTYKDVPPLLSEYDGRAGVYFYGRTSNLYMQFATNGTDKALTGIRHAFIVHGVKDCWGCALGYSTTRDGGMVLDTDSFVRSLSDCRFFLHPRLELAMDYSGGRFFLNGDALDPFSTKPTTGEQMLEVDFMDRGSPACWLYRCGFETYVSGGANKGNQGGDYLSEIVLFTTTLSETERLDVSRYLLKKWNLPRLANAEVRHLRPAGTVNAATNSAVAITGDATMTAPLTFTGEGSVTKSGSSVLTMAPSGDEPFRGTFELEDGAVLSCGGRPLPLAAKAGNTYDSSAYKHTGEATGPENSVKSGFKLTRATGAGAGTVRKTGTGEVRFSSVASDVGMMEVQSGVVTLESRPGGLPTYAENLSDAVIAVTNASFEIPVDIASTSDGRYLFGGWLNGWAYVWLDGDHTYPSYTGIDEGWSNWSSVPPPDGRQALTLNTRSSARAYVEIPKAGRYRLSFKAIARYGYRKGGTSVNWVHQVDVSFYKDGGSRVYVGSFCPNSSSFAPFNCAFDVASTGKYRLEFAALDNCGDETTTIDDVHLVYDVEPVESVAFKVPNGDFEKLAPRSTIPHRYSYFTALDAAEDWTFELDSSAVKTNFYVGLLSPLKCLDWAYSVSLYRFGSVDLGGNMLGLFKTLGKATTATFTAPKGTYKLQAKAAYVGVEAFSTYVASSTPQIHAKLLRAGKDTIDLGVIKPTSTLLTTMKWPNEVTFEEPEDVALVLSLDNSTGGGAVDDLVFVTPTDGTEELLADGGFERADDLSATGAWKRSNDNSYYVYSAAVCWNYYTITPRSAYGYSAFEGSQRIGIRNAGLFTQDLNFPTSGLHRLKLHAATRIDDVATSRNPLRFWLTKIDSGVTNIIDTMAMPMTYNWFEREYLFDVPSSGDYRFGIEGGCGLEEIDTSKYADRMSFLDGLSIKRVVDAPADAPTVPEDLKIKVTSGARMVLNYPGRIRVRRLVLGGKPTGDGVFSAKTHPKFFGGMGEIEVNGIGTMFIVR